jgi:hypothetical protein
MLTVERIADRPDRRGGVDLVEAVGVGDGRVLGGIKWSSQHSMMEVLRWESEAAGGNS